MARDSNVSALEWDGVGRGTIGGGGGIPDGRPSGNGGGPGSSSMRLSGLSSGLRGSNGDGRDWGGGIDVEISAGTIGSGAGWIGGTGREIGGGGGGTMKRGAGTFTGSTSPSSSGAPLLRTSFSSGFRSLPEDNKMDCDQ